MLDPRLIAKGERFILEDNLVELAQFVQKNLPFVDQMRLMDRIEELVDTEQLDEAVRYWQRVTKAYEGNTKIFLSIMSRWIFHKLWWFMIFGGVLGGWLSLIQWIKWILYK